jgi:hypothetical protein
LDKCEASTLSPLPFCALDDQRSEEVGSRLPAQASNQFDALLIDIPRLYPVIALNFWEPPFEADTVPSGELLSIVQLPECYGVEPKPVPIWIDGCNTNSFPMFFPDLGQCLYENNGLRFTRPRREYLFRVQQKCPFASVRQYV